MNKSEQAVSIFNSRAEGYHQKYKDVSLYSNDLDMFCQFLPKKDSVVLELACGPGNLTKYILDKRPDFRIDCSDLSENMLRIAEKNAPTAEFSIMDMRNISSLNKLYDGIICGFGLPYLEKDEVIQFITDAAGKLEESGILFISTMEDDYAKSGLVKSTSGNSEEMFIHYHELSYLTNALIENDFEILHTSRSLIQGQEKENVRDLVLIARLKPRN